MAWRKLIDKSWILLDGKLLGFCMGFCMRLLGWGLDVGGVGNLHCSGQSSFENWNSIPPQVITIYNLGMCFRQVEKRCDHIDFVDA